MNDDTKKGLTLVTGDKEPKVYMTEKHSREVHDKIETFGEQLRAMGFASIINAVSDQEIQENCLAVMTVGQMKNTSDETCNAMLAATFETIEDIINLNPMLKVRLDELKRDIFRSIKGNE